MDIVVLFLNGFMHYCWLLKSRCFKMLLHDYVIFAVNVVNGDLKWMRMNWIKYMN